MKRSVLPSIVAGGAFLVFFEDAGDTSALDGAEIKEGKDASKHAFSLSFRLPHRKGPGRLRS